MLKPGGRFYIEVDYMSKEEYREYEEYILTRHQENPEIFPSDFVSAYFDRESLERFILEHGLTIEKEVSAGENYRYVFEKKDLPK